MSIPYFFHPMKVKRIPKGPDAEQLWEDLASYRIAEEGRLPGEVLFIDGGIMSNFPIDVFHNTNKVPLCSYVWCKARIGQASEKY
ncbi:hypothetical protein D3C84_1071160 [compost metagenome]